MKWMIALASLLAVTALADAADARDRFKARLNGAQEVPPNGTESTGRFIITFNNDLTEGEFTLHVNHLDNVTRAHLHCNVAGANGPIFLHLIGDMHLIAAGGPAPQHVDGRWLDNATVTDASISDKTTLCGATLADVVAAMRAGSVYVNVHTTAFPGGEIRGQVEED
jgi:hypothetical protein